MASLRELLEALRPRKWGVTPNNVDETNPFAETDLANLLLLELLQQRGEQMQQQNEHL